MADPERTLQTSNGLRRLTRFFADAPYHWHRLDDGGSCVMCLSSLRNIMYSCSNNPDPAGCRAMLDAGGGTAMIRLLRNQTWEEWLMTNEHCCCINYAVSILGSAIHARLPESYFIDLLERGALDVLIPLLAGSCSWIEAPR